MQFKLCESYEFWWPVSVQMPHPDRPGDIQDQQFEARFLLTNTEELADLEKQGQEVLITAILKDWRNVTDGDDQDITFSADSLSRCLPFTHFRVAVYKAYLTALNGQKVKSKN
ncbi:MAG: hypothetical protein ABJQ71_15100 [Roseibium sp.]